MILDIGLLFSYTGQSYFINQNKFKKIQDELEKFTTELHNYCSYDKYRLTTRGFIFSKRILDENKHINKFYIIPIDKFINLVINDGRLSRNFHSKIYEKIYGYGLFIENSNKYFIPMTDIDDLFDYKEDFKNTFKELDNIYEEYGDFYCIKYEKKYLLNPENVTMLNIL